MATQIDVHMSPRTQVGPRMTTLPVVEHPMSRLGTKRDLNVQGSASGSLGGSLGPKSQTLAEFRNLPTLQSRDRKHERILTWPLEYLSLPGHRAATENKVKLGSKGPEKFEPRRFEVLIKEKLQTGHHALRHLFKGNDPTLRGMVSREALLKILFSFIGYISNENYNNFLRHLKLDDRDYIGYEEFISCFQEENEPKKEWLKPASQKNLALPDKEGSRLTVSIEAPVLATATFCVAMLKEKVMHRTLNAQRILPAACLEDGGRIVPPQLREAMAQLGMRLSDEEFKKLWDRFDVRSIGIIKTAKFFGQLGLFPPGERDQQWAAPQCIAPVAHDNVYQSDRRDADRLKSVKEVKKAKGMPKLEDIVDNLHYKFEEPYNKLFKSFKLFDFQRDGFISRVDIRRIFKEFGLNVTATELEYFLSRCAVRILHGQINYKEFLSKFQNKSETGIVSRIVNDEFHAFGKNSVPATAEYLDAEALEAKLVEFLHHDFLKILASFRSTDKYSLGVVPQHEFRSVVEKCLGFAMNTRQWERLQERAQVDQDGLVPYPHFLEIFTSPAGAWNKKNVGNVTVPKVQQLPTPSEADRLKSEIQKTQTTNQQGRSIEEIKSCLKPQLTKHFQRVDKYFNKLDPKMTKRLSKNQLDAILKEVGIHVSSVELNRLWSSLGVQDDGLFTWTKFLGQFMESRPIITVEPKQMAKEPRNISPVKVAPTISEVHEVRDSEIDVEIDKLKERKIQSENMLDRLKVTRSRTNQSIRTVGGTKDVLLEKIRNEVTTNWEHLKFIFRNLDVSGTCCIQQSDMKDCMETFEFPLSQTETFELCRKFDKHRDGRFHYMDFMRMFTSEKLTDGINVSKEKPFSITSVVREKTPPMSPCPRKTQQTFILALTDKIRNKLLLESKSLRRAFKKADADNNGCLDITEFKAVLRKCAVQFDEDVFYHIVSHFDENLDGTISYDEFLRSLMNY